MSLFQGTISHLWQVHYLFIIAFQCKVTYYQVQLLLLSLHSRIVRLINSFNHFEDHLILLLILTMLSKRYWLGHLYYRHLFLQDYIMVIVSWYLNQQRLLRHSFSSFAHMFLSTTWMTFLSPWPLLLLNNLSYISCNWKNRPKWLHNLNLYTWWSLNEIFDRALLLQ